MSFFLSWNPLYYLKTRLKTIETNHVCKSYSYCFFKQGVQAQTVANFYLAFEKELAIIPVMNKIDLKVAKPEETEEQMCSLFDFTPEEILRVSFQQLSHCLTIDFVGYWRNFSPFDIILNL